MMLANDEMEAKWNKKTAARIPNRFRVDSRADGMVKKCANKWNHLLIVASQSDAWRRQWLKITMRRNVWLKKRRLVRKFWIAVSGSTQSVLHLFAKHIISFSLLARRLGKLAIQERHQILPFCKFDFVAFEAHHLCRGGNIEPDTQTCLIAKWKAND